LGFLKFLKQAKVPLNEYEFPSKKITNVQTQLEKLIEKNYYLHRSARDAYKSYIAAYASHQHKEIFDARQLDLLGIAKSFGFTHPPAISLNIDSVPMTRRRRGGGTKGTGVVSTKNTFQAKSVANRGVFSASNPTGNREKNDKRQFAKY